MMKKKEGLAMGDARVSEVISFTEDIKPYRFIQIYAGVGSGKNYFIEQLMKGHTDRLKDGTTVELEKQTVLLITSRRAKVDETLSDEDLPADGKVGRWDEFHVVYTDEGEPTKPLGKLRVLKDEWGKRRVYQRSVVCTNAFIEKYMQYRYDPRDITTHLWELFDIIVVDEVHSMVLDATFQSAPFYVQELVNKFLELHKFAEKNPSKYRAPLCKHMILMTGSPDPIENFTVPKNSIVLNKFEECRNVVPQNIHFITAKDAKEQIVEQVRRGERVVYFSNHVVFPSRFCADTDIPLDQVAVSFSDPDRRDKMSKDDPVAYDNMVRVEDSLMKESELPEDIKIFITTSRNKEGININNEDVGHLYVESHIRSDVIQMAGRIRSGVEHMYVITDTKVQGGFGWEHEADFCKTKIAGSAKKADDVCGAANEYLESLCSKYGIKDLYKKGASAQTTAYAKNNEQVAAFINYIHDKFPFIRYSYLHNVFQFYNLRVTGRNYSESYREAFKQAAKNPKHYQTILQKWFAASTVHSYVALDEKARLYFEEAGLTDESKLYSDDDLKKIMADLNEIYGTEITRLNSLLGRFSDYECVRGSNTKDRPSYEKFKFRIKKALR